MIIDDSYKVVPVYTCPECGEELRSCSDIFMSSMLTACDTCGSVYDIVLQNDMADKAKLQCVSKYDSIDRIFNLEE